LISFGLALRARGFRILYVGADTPIETLVDAANAARPHVVVVSAVNPERFDDVGPALRDLAAEYPLFLGGAGAAPVGDEFTKLTGDPVEEADHLMTLAEAR
jgi:methanogenic corrinoid protein MtbC1